MKIIELVISFSAFVFCFVRLIFLQINTKTKRKNKKKFSFKNLPIEFNFKNLPIKRKKLLVLLLTFLLLAILLKNIVFPLTLCILFLYLDWYIKDKNKRKRTNLIDKQVVEALTIIKNLLQAGQSLQNALEL
ncbi:hypothetical protein AGMMS49950_11120 [Endomicrobiia bacterium]|nr:hypothetical protein AGMMS49950_11120 [Endomicrobiia bacterium]